MSSAASLYDVLGRSGNLATAVGKEAAERLAKVSGGTVVSHTPPAACDHGLEEPGQRPELPEQGEGASGMATGSVIPQPSSGSSNPSAATSWPRGHAFGFGLLDDGSYRFWLPRWLVLARWPFKGKRWRADRKRLARLRALYWIVVRNYETELCERCGGPVGVVYHAPDDLWELATGYARFADGEAAPGVLCPKCLDDLVEPQIAGYLTWTCAVTR